MVVEIWDGLDPIEEVFAEALNHPLSLPSTGTPHALLRVVSEDRQNILGISKNREVVDDLLTESDLDDLANDRVSHADLL